jgi:hypothetical protein
VIFTTSLGQETPVNFDIGPRFPTYKYMMEVLYNNNENKLRPQFFVWKKNYPEK